MTPEEKKEKNRQYQRKYHETHKEEVRLRNKKWRMANPEKVTEYQHNYWIKNKDRIMQKRREKNPPKDKVEVVRCKNCKFYMPRLKMCYKHGDVAEDWFCGDGRKNDEKESKHERKDFNYSFDH